MSRSVPRWAGTVAALALGVALTSCTSTSGSSASTSTPGSDTTSAEPQLSASPNHDPSREEQVTALWEDVHAQRLAQVYAAAGPDVGVFANLATQQAAEALLDLIRAARGDVPTNLVGSEVWPSVDISAGGDKAAIADCILVAMRPASQPDAGPTVHSQVWKGSAVATDDGWLIDAISVGADNCVPRELNQQLLGAYADYHKSWTAAWDPPDASHPLLERTMTGKRLEGIRRLLEADRAKGITFRDPHDPLENAVVFELGIGQATVSDCHQAHPGYGAYDVETGERLEKVIPPVDPGQLNLTSVRLIRTDGGVWKVAEAAARTDTNCEPRGTRYVVAP
ncbi:MAG: hypothetical protein M3O70_23055 [Actinomycetota bacterium]|nr:hypothetical protein [Actinomycetota bacterium]